MTDQFKPTPETTTVDGYRWGQIMQWEDLDWSRREWRPSETLGDHWLVPSKHTHHGHRTRHRVRKAKAWEMALWKALDEAFAEAVRLGAAPVGVATEIEIYGDMLRTEWDSDD